MQSEGLADEELIPCDRRKGTDADGKAISDFHKRFIIPAELAAWDGIARRLLIPRGRFGGLSGIGYRRIGDACHS